MPEMLPHLNANAAAISALRRRRRISGMCAEPGCKYRSGEAYRCEHHAAMNAERVNKHRKLKEQRGRPSWG